MLLNIGALIVVLGVLIFVHEAGHFIAAKAVGVQVLRFSLGFGPPIVAFTRGETEYWISWIPLGGYVKMAGLEDEGLSGELEGGRPAVPVDPARAFDQKPVWARVVVLVAGVTMNVILAFLLYTGIGVVMGTPQVASTVIDSVDTRKLPPGAEALAALRSGDRILRLNDDSVGSWNDLLDGILDARGMLRFEVAGRADPLVVTIADSADTTLALSLIRRDPPKFGFIEPGHAASHAGLRTGDVVLRVNGDTVQWWSDLVRVIRRSPEQPLHFDVLRDGSVLSMDVVPEKQDSVGMIFAVPDPPVRYVPLTFGEAVQDGVRRTGTGALAILEFLRQLMVGKQSVRELGGPILIGQVSGQMVRLGLREFLMFMAFFSVQLAVLNLLPIPVLDGGNLVFVIAEGIRGKPIDLKIRLRLLNIGFWVLIAIMLFAVGNDVLRFIPR